ncbi:MAG: hypothetical protein EAZ09_11760 [Oscillatoriales cyanobacterium]|nr:MAG: hypothetical protein EAZ18_10380 [Oscillatoriales cyanobacterium]TAH21764.1 MAG: hypothetical protein EAZ09_11760 [Oscillatoriales cyanobacterium]
MGNLIIKYVVKSSTDMKSRITCCEGAATFYSLFQVYEVVGTLQEPIGVNNQVQPIVRQGLKQEPQSESPLFLD